MNPKDDDRFYSGIKCLVAMEEPSPITLSLPNMKKKNIDIAACGESDKYPQGKSDGMRRVIAIDDETLTSFPAVILRNCATWVLNEMAASKVGDACIVN